MILDLMRVWPVESERSFLIGDRLSDMAAAERRRHHRSSLPGGDLEAFVEQCLRASADNS